MKEIFFKLFAYPILVFVSWMLLGRILTLIVSREDMRLLSFSFFNYLFLATPFLIASSLFWFNQNSKMAFILGASGALLTWLLLFITSGSFNIQLNMLGLTIFTSFLSGALAFTVAFIKEKLIKKDPPPSSFVPV